MIDAFVWPYPSERQLPIVAYALKEKMMFINNPNEVKKKVFFSFASDTNEDIQIKTGYSTQKKTDWTECLMGKKSS